MFCKKLTNFVTLFRLGVSGRRNARISVFEVGSADILQGLNEVIKDFGGHHDTVAVGADLFGNAHHTASGIALEVDEECFAVRYDFLCANDIVVHCTCNGSVLCDP